VAQVGGICEFYPKTMFGYWLIQITDRLTPKHTFFMSFALTAIGFYLRFTNNNLGDNSFSNNEELAHAAIGVLE